jgi:hypothetical protein
MNDAPYLADLSKNLKLSATGEWWHDGRPFENRKLIELFNRSIVWDQNKDRYLLQIGGNQASFEYEDTVYFVTSLHDQNSPWKLALSDQTEELLAPSSLSLGSQNQIYCTVKGSHRARFSRGAHQQLLAHAVDDTSLLLDGKNVSLVKRSPP